MILTNCAACAAPLPHKAKQCSRCKTRYCGPACQKQHWDAAGGHKDLCKLIKKGGGAEEYHADKKYKEAVAEAVEECAEDTKGQTCFICTQALHWKTKEGLVRGCSCRGTAGFAHVSCLAEQVKILVAEAEENNLEGEDMIKRTNRWHMCSLCEQQHHGVVACALGWACWKTYLGRPEADWLRGDAMTKLGNGLFEARLHEDAIPVFEAKLSILQRICAPVENTLVAQGNLANTYDALGRSDEGLRLRRDVYSGWLKLYGEEYYDTLREANNYADTLVKLERFEETKALLHKMIPVAQRVLGKSNHLTLAMKLHSAMAIYYDVGAALDDLRLAVNTLEETSQISRRVLGGAHPTAVSVEKALRDSRRVLHAHLNSDSV